MPRAIKGTLREIGNALKLSDGTVSRALSGRGDIAQETRDRVAELAAALKYVPRRKTLTQTTRLTRIAVCIGNPCVSTDGALDPSYVGLSVLTQIEQIASQENVGVMVAFMDAMAPDLRVDRFPMLQPGESQGIILVYPYPDGIVRKLTSIAPVVSIEHVHPGVPVDVIGPTQALDAMSAVEHLHRLGHRRIAYVSDEEARGHKLTLGLRHAGYVSGLARCDLSYRREDVLNIDGPTVSKPDLAKRVAKLARDGVTAVISSIDRHGYLLWNELPALGIRIPADLSLVGIGGIYRPKGTPQLTTWRCNYQQIAALAIQTLRNRNQNSETPHAYVEIASEFLAGETSALSKH